MKSKTIKRILGFGLSTGLVFASLATIFASPVPVAADSLEHLEECGGVVGQDFTPVPASLPEAAEGFVPRRPRVRLALDRSVVSLFGLIRHTAANVRGVIENAACVKVHVPFARHVGVITRITQ